MRALLGWIVAYLFRWLPHASPTGLFALGEPDEGSPVIVTADFSLTVRRVRRGLAGTNAWLLVAHTGGINVWCAAAGGLFTEHRVIDAIKVSGLADRVTHRRVVLPALSASGIDGDAVRKATGFRVAFGPVYAKDVPAYLATGEKTESMKRFHFGPRHRLDMFLSMNLPVYLLLAAAVTVLSPGNLLPITVLFWTAVALLYAAVDVLPGRTGWRQAIFAAALVVVGWAAIDAYVAADPLAHWGWMLATVTVFLFAGFDLAGTISARRSDAELLMHRLGFTRFGSVFTAREVGEVRLERELCQGCGTCADICPVGVFAGLDADRKTSFEDQRACFGCGACVKQCPTRALSLSNASGHGGQRDVAESTEPRSAP